jgi:hypothetical protein
MNILAVFGLLAGLLNIIAYIPYIRDTIKGETSPNRTSWFIWTTLALISFFSQKSSGATWSLCFIAIQVLGPLTVFMLSIKRGEGGFEALDLFSLIGAIVGLLAWAVSGRPEMALYFNLSVDMFGVLPTLKKSYLDPSGETISLYVLTVVAAVLAGLSVGKLSPILLLYPVYIFLADGAVLVALLTSPNRKGR